jgi:zinc protease
MMRALLLLCISLCMLPAWAGDLHTVRLGNGLRVVVLPTTAAQVVSIAMLLDYSALDEPEAQRGIRQVLLNSMLQGSSAVGGSTIQQTLAAVGGRLEGRVHQDVLELSVTVPAQMLTLGMAALTEIVCRPQLAERGFSAALQQAHLTAAQAPYGAVDAALRDSHDLLYAGHPYATRGVGTPDTLAGITPAAVRAAYGQHITPGSSVLAIVGRCDREEGIRTAGELFSTWEDRPRAPRLPAASPLVQASRLALRQTAVRSTCVMLTFPVPGATSDDFLALRLVDCLLSGGTGSRLFRSVREEAHLAYEVATVFPSQGACSHFSVYALTHTSYMEETKAALVEVLAQLQVEPVQPDELARAKAYLNSRYLLSHQYSAQYAFDLAWYELLGLGADYDRILPKQIDALTAADIQRVARTYFTRYFLVVVMPES